MKKRFVAIALILALAVTLCPAALAAGKLSTPTGLAWGWEFGFTDQIFWNFGENTASIVRIVIYKDDRQLLQTETDYEEDLSNTEMSDHLSYLLAEADLPMESGVYRFTVQNIAALNADSDDDSDVATSSQWTYTAPDAQLAPPVDPAWDFPCHTWRRGTDAKPQEANLQLCFCESENGDYQEVSISYCEIGEDLVRLPVDIWALEKCGAGYYKFRIMNLSDDLSQSQHSPWSPYSEPYYYDGSPVDICNHPNHIYEDGQDATCTEPGRAGNTICADCGEVIWYGSSIPALGHDPNADGVCQRCGEYIGYRGTLGENAELAWTYSAETGLVTFDGVIPVDETVLVACYEDGRFTGVKAATSNASTVEVGTAFDQLRLFWLSDQQTPKCPAGSLSLKP